MNSNFGEDFKYYETTIVLKDFLDKGSDGSINEIINIFQTLKPQVVRFTHAGKSEIEVIDDFYLENSDMSKDTIKISFKKAFELINQTNMPKPHSRYCVLRKEVGPIDANPQYIFGNEEAQIYVDAMTGNISDKNPVYPN